MPFIYRFDGTCHHVWTCLGFVMYRYIHIHPCDRWCSSSTALLRLTESDYPLASSNFSCTFIYCSVLCGVFLFVCLFVCLLVLFFVFFAFVFCFCCFRFCLFVFVLCLACAMLPVSLKYPFLISPSVLYNS